jgi:RNA polymerase sigma factor (sigma-70 family)
MRDEPGHILEQQIPALRRYAYGLTRDHDAADDLVQDCLERALSRWLLHRKGSDLTAWLFTILRNLYIDRYRASRRRGQHTSIDDALELPVAAEQDRTIEARNAFAALDLLPEEQRSILLLIGVEDLSYEQAAQVLELPIGTVMSRLSRARQRLRELMETGHFNSYLRRVK